MTANNSNVRAGQIRWGAAVVPREAVVLIVGRGSRDDHIRSTSLPLTQQHKPYWRLQYEAVGRSVCDVVPRPQTDASTNRQNVRKITESEYNECPDQYEHYHQNTVYERGLLRRLGHDAVVDEESMSLGCNPTQYD